MCCSVRSRSRRSIFIGSRSAAWCGASPTASRATCVIGLYLFGWLLLLYTTFLIDHFDLFGLKQVWRRLANKTYRAPVFRTPSLYKLVRHPLYIGWLTIFWAAPTMTVSHLIFALATTAYILIAIRFEERDLVSAFGNVYVDYRARTPMLIPRLWLAAPRSSAESFKVGPIMTSGVRNALVCCPPLNQSALGGWYAKIERVALPRSGESLHTAWRARSRGIPFLAWRYELGTGSWVRGERRSAGRSRARWPA